MKDPKRIDKVLAVIKKIWNKNPELRLMQLLGNCFVSDPYYTEDKDLITYLKIVYKEEKK